MIFMMKYVLYVLICYITLDFIHNQITILLFVNNNFLEIGT